MVAGDPVFTSNPPDSIGAASKLRHDLLTPINHLIGYSEILLEEFEHRGAPSLAAKAGQIRAIGKEAGRLIHEALPSGHEQSIAEALASLRGLLPEPAAKIIQTVSAIRADVSDTIRELVDPDLGKVTVAANRLLGLIGVDAGSPSPAASMTPAIVEQRARGGGQVLVVDDDEANRDLLSRRLEREGFQVSQAGGGSKALEMLSRGAFDLVLLDAIMPDVDGFEVLRRLKAEGRLINLPVIMISAMDEVGSAVRCIDLGAEDYLTKPCDPILLRARIGACLEKKRLRDEERLNAAQLRAALTEVEEQKRFSESLLRNILPARISEELRTTGQVVPKYYDDVTIVFTDFVGFTLSTENLAADDLVAMLHEYFTAFDQIVKRYGLEKLKTIGDSYMFMGGLPPRSPSHPIDSVLACLEIVQAVERLRTGNGAGWGVRIGVHIGPVIAGVVGIEKFAFDVWGETVNYSSRMETAGEPGRINLSALAYSRVKDFVECESRGKVLTKEQRTADMYFVKGILPKLLQDLSIMPPPQFVRRYRTYFERDPPAFPPMEGVGR